MLVFEVVCNGINAVTKDVCFRDKIEMKAKLTEILGHGASTAVRTNITWTIVCV
jgi:hypothetical protein